MADKESEAELLSIVNKSGAHYHRSENIRGEPEIVVEHITDKESDEIWCAFGKWETPRARAAGVVASVDTWCKP